MLAGDPTRRDNVGVESEGLLHPPVASQPVQARAHRLSLGSRVGDTARLAEQLVCGAAEGVMALVKSGRHGVVDLGGGGLGSG